MGLQRKGLAEREEKERALSSERAHKKVLTVKKNMHLILNSSTGTLVTVAINEIFPLHQMEDSTARVCSQAKPAHIPQNNYRRIKVQMTRRHQGGTPIPHPSA